MLLGVHCSVSGGLEKAFTEAKKLDIDTFQIFTRNQRQWKAKPITKKEKESFTKAFSASKIKTAFSHASYLINLASDSDELWNKSVNAMIAEVERCEALGLAYTVVHPGAAKDKDENTAMETVVKALKQIIKATKGNNVIILLENTAGQGTTLGYNFQHLAKIIDMTESERTAACFDTCHAYAAGYDISNNHGFKKTFEEWNKLIGANNLKAIHLNDSKTQLGSRVDRHAHIGQGEIGNQAFKLILKSFPHIPKILETPKDGNMDEKNLEVLRTL